MLEEEYKELQKKYNQASTLKYNIDELQKELNNLKQINEEELKNMYCYKLLSGYVIDDREWMFQKIICERIIHFAIHYRENRIKQLQQQFQEL